MSDTVFAIQLTLGWAWHHGGPFWAIGTYIALVLTGCWVIDRPQQEAPPLPRDTAHDDEVIAAMRQLGDVIAVAHIVATSKPAPVDNESRRLEEQYALDDATHRNTERGNR